MIESASLLKRVSEQPDLQRLLERDVQVSEELAISDKGDIVGTTGDYYVDAASGELQAIEVVTEDDRGEATHVVPMPAIVRIGADLVMVVDDFASRSVPSGEEL